ncbi:uncharacterized protein LY79DRAFT_4801 [Colletotrichum navitas]|uniref:Secreted protein n=1 Tax=Colletotrichum navitas TaxID=681940 RepID=A0AAD8QEQ7_9PEZI|nr:uncharacterized protein LY79DRAFT_4801 [Colletotrichum navitas]KAK1600042.1 hypothetical protein LY79DRAFT_4801 [Colletotrichum navitas]
MGAFECAMAFVHPPPPSLWPYKVMIGMLCLLAWEVLARESMLCVANIGNGVQVREPRGRVAGFCDRHTVIDIM